MGAIWRAEGTVKGKVWLREDRPRGRGLFRRGERRQPSRADRANRISLGAGAIRAALLLSGAAADILGSRETSDDLKLVRLAVYVVDGSKARHVEM